MIQIKDRKKEMDKYPPIFSRIIAAGYDISKLMEPTVTVFGCGGLGAELAIKLARTGISNFILVDKDEVGVENLNRMVYTREDAGKPKVEVLKKKLEALRNNDEEEKYHIKVLTYHDNVLANEELLNKIFNMSTIICCCFDNKTARMEVNWYFTKTKNLFNLYIDGGTSADGLEGTIYTLIKDMDYPCIECYKGALVSLKGGKSQKPMVPCGASLATTMSLVSTIMADVVFKYIDETKGPMRRNVKEIIPPEIRVNLNGTPGIGVRDRKKRASCEACGNETR